MLHGSSGSPQNRIVAERENGIPGGELIKHADGVTEQAPKMLVFKDMVE